MSDLEVYIKFDEVKKVLTICTPGNNKIVLNDMAKSIKIKDQNGNSIIMSPKGIDINSSKNINISADQKINIKGTQGIQIASSGGDVEVSGINIKQSADAQYSANGNASATFSASAQLTIRGAIVLIN